VVDRLFLISGLYANDLLLLARWSVQVLRWRSLGLEANWWSLQHQFFVCQVVDVSLESSLQLRWLGLFVGLFGTMGVLFVLIIMLTFIYLIIPSLFLALFSIACSFVLIPLIGF
jgi:hypothetical protein